MALELSETNLHRVQRILQDFLVMSESQACLVCDSGGHALVEHGMTENDPFLIAALGAGGFAASRELARLLGEDEFSAVFHQGDKKSIFIRAIDGDALLVVIFSNRASLGLVKLYSAPAAAELRLILAGDQRSADPEEGQFVVSESSRMFG